MIMKGQNVDGGFHLATFSSLPSMFVNAVRNVPVQPQADYPSVNHFFSLDWAPSRIGHNESLVDNSHSASLNPTPASCVGHNVSIINS